MNILQRFHLTACTELKCMGGHFLSGPFLHRELLPYSLIMKGMTDQKMMDFSKLIVRNLRNYRYCELH